ncbi:SDR family NAD(P)-dependent oxidoreductase [Pseudomonas oryzihabitans]|uniref:Short-chain dehydrogenase n=1 Tax=Pseudomonas oryzihabitans TaxID=47885 RepID=A0A1G5M4P3_9PSED|nr:SDR family NAD(P)-dependent oxidoreductase [Pseudomonas psychrotolerans]NMY88777.1 SDR family NAD(P)-dependent oxidoreductase [Pseudomonas psychrotolerans]SCZ20152.1 Short-chain dehydrogenase [Pseudomonas psychrotolerans]
MRTLPLLLALPAALALLNRTSSRRSPRIDRQQLNGRTIVVTGASSGVGRGVALALARHGANLVLAARRSEALEALAVEVQALGVAALAVPTDVADVAQMTALAEQAEQRFGRIDGWINNAGVVAVGRFEEVPLEDHLRLLDTNVKGVAIGTHLALQRFRRQGYGRLVNVASVDGEIPHAYQASYSASKAAVLSLGRVLQQELRRGRQPNIQLSTVLPWALDTPIWGHAATYTGHRADLPTKDSPDKAVQAIVGALLQPQKEITVGYKAKLAYWGHRLAPELNERFTAAAVQRAEIDWNPAKAATSGNLQQPDQAGRTIMGSNF